MKRNPNPLALKLDGNSLEVLAAVTICGSSHNDFRSSSISFSGQLMQSFIESIGVNMILNRTDDISRFVIKWDECKSLQTFVKDFKIPFLFALNMPVPKLLASIRSVNVGSSRRTADKSQINIVFDIDPSRKFVGVAECKNWTQKIKFSDLTSIIEKAINTKNCKINLIFCNTVIEPEKSTKVSLLKRFEDFCETRNVHVYRFERKENLNYKIVPFSNCSAQTKIKMAVVIFELSEFNQITKKRGQQSFGIKRNVKSKK